MNCPTNHCEPNSKSGRGTRFLIKVINRTSHTKLEQAEYLAGSELCWYELLLHLLFERLNPWAFTLGGNETALMARLLGNNAHLVSYGAMSKQPLSLPTSLFIFKNLTSHGFWQTRWYQTQSQEEKGHVMQTLVDLMAAGKVFLIWSSVLLLRSTLSIVEGTKTRDFVHRCPWVWRWSWTESPRCNS